MAPKCIPCFHFICLSTILGKFINFEKLKIEYNNDNCVCFVTFLEQP